jgi:hypothetical protein
MKVLVLWCPNHETTERQRYELEAREQNPVSGTRKEVYIVPLKMANPKLFSELSNCPGDWENLRVLAYRLLDECKKYDTVVLPIGSPGLQYMFAQITYKGCFRVLFAHSERESQDASQPDGSVKKISVFTHKFFF